MINEPLLKMALSLNTNPGAYALLIGSGVSTAAGIPTSQTIVVDLIRKLAAMEGEELQLDPVTWYQQKFSKYPRYDTLLDSLTTTPSERMALLRSYFEPTPDDLEKNLKVPTSAHQAIAALAKLGYIRIILTTNFDRLMEKALDKVGIVPDVISSEDHLKGAVPYVHSQCYLVKLHGDYIDTRIKNTPEELADYPPEINTLLDRILDEFGLVVCGWSSSSDVALRNSILRCPNRRYTTFWLQKGELSEEAEDLIRHRRAESLCVESADHVFNELLERTKSLRELELTHPLSTDIAVSTVKRYLVDPKSRIRLHDLIKDESERVYLELNSDKFKIDGVSPDKEHFQQRMHQYEAIVERLMAMLVALSYHDEGKNADLLTNCIERLVSKPRQGGYTHLNNLQLYPALLITYAGGICSLSAKRFNNLAAILRTPKYRDYYNHKKIPAIEKLQVFSVFDQNAGILVPRLNAEREFTAASNYLLEVIRPFLRDYIPDDIKYEESFNIFEYLLALTFRDLLGMQWSPVGRYGWCYKVRSSLEISPIDEFIAEGQKEGSEWELLKAGFFDGSIDRLNNIIEDDMGCLQEIARGWH